MSFVEITGPDYTALLVRRLRREVPELTWLRQFRRLLRPLVAPGDTLLDVGCATGYAFHAFAELGVRYVGLDAEEAYLEIARDYFHNDPRVSFVNHDIASAPLPVRGAIVMTCATIEHCASLQPSLGHLASAAERVLAIRTFLGAAEIIERRPSKVPGHSEGFWKHINRYGFAQMLGFLESSGFAARVYQDAYFRGAPQLVQDDIVRTFYVVVAVRRDQAGQP